MSSPLPGRDEKPIGADHREHDEPAEHERPASNVPPAPSGKTSKTESSASVDSKVEDNTAEAPTSQELTQKSTDPEKGNPERADEKLSTEGSDPEVVTWNGPDDPSRPINWTKTRKWSNMAVVSAITFLTPLASSMVAPGVGGIMREFRSSNATIASFIISIYIVGYAVGPLFLAPLSELYGRLPLYHANNVLFVIWSMACALAPNIPAMLVFRLFCEIAGSCPLTIGGGTIADIFVQEERGVAMAIFSLGPLMGPVIGPVGGGFLAEDAGWRWVFWLLTIAGGVVAVGAIFVLDETHGPTILETRARKLRKTTGNPNVRSSLALPYSKTETFKQAIVRPTKMLIFSPIVLTLSIYMALVYSYLYFFFTTLSALFERQYHWSEGVVGLSFIGLGLGSLIGMLVFGAISDRMVKRFAAINGGEMKPEYRLPPLVMGCLFIPIGLFIYGWTAEKKVHWITPIIGTAFVGIGQIATFMPIATYLVDAFTAHAASAMAANTVLRSLAGAFLPLAGPSLFRALGYGWGNSLLGFIALLMAPVTWFLYKKGESIRNSKRFQVTF